MPTIDSHVHFWNYDAQRDAWITEEMSVIRRNFLPQDAHASFLNYGLEGCVAVQASQSEEETQFLLGLAEQHSFVKGIVGWVDLKSPTLEERLSYYRSSRLVKGWRHIVQAEPLGFMLNDAFCRGLSLLRRFDYTYDLLIYPHQMEDALKVVTQFPHQAFVVDHCAKPDLKNGDLTQWKKNIHALGLRPNVCCKLSGLLTEADWKQWKKEEIYRCLDVIFECFGSRRVLFGSDWPVMLLAAEHYGIWKSLIDEYVSAFSEDEKKAIFGGNALSFYNL